MENDLIKSLNKIKSTINENDQMVLACQASTQCYNEAIKKLKNESERLYKEIARLDGEIKEYKPQVDILEKCVKVQEDTLRISQESLLTHLSYKKCVEDNLNKHKKEADTLIEEYSKHYQQCKEKLERTNPIYKTLQEKRTELKKCKIECLILQQRIAQRKRIKKQKTEIKKKLFYSDFVSLATAWLRQKKYLAVMKEFEEIKQKEKQCMIRLLEEKENFKMKQKMGYSRKNEPNKVPQIEFLKNEMKNDMNVIIGGRQTNDLKQFEKPVPNPFYELKDLLEEKTFTPPDSINTDLKRTASRNNYFPKTEFNAMHSKVRILENQVVKLPQEMTKPAEIPSKEERSKAIDAKLQKVVQNFNRSLSQQRQNQKSLKRHSSKLRNDKKFACSQEENPAKMEVVENCNSQKETGATQELENLNIISQETNESVLNLLSQESTKNPESKLKKFKYSPERSLPSQDSKVSTQAEKNGVRLGIKSTPLKNSQIGLKNSKTDPRSDKAVLRKTSEDGFKKSDAIPFVKNGQFSMGSGTSTFGGPFANKEQKTESNHFLTKTGTNQIFKADSAPMGLPQNFNVNNVFKKPEQSVVFANPEVTHMDTTNNQVNHVIQTEERNGKQNDFIDESNFLNMGSQYNFGNITQLSQDLNETGVNVIGHGWLFRAGATLHQGVVQEILEAITKGNVRSIRSMLDAGWRLEASQALYNFLTRLGQPLIPPSIQSLVLDDSGNVPIEIVATDVLGLMKQELPNKHLRLATVLLHLLDTIIKISPADELRGNAVPISMLPLFFNIQTQHINEWRRIATIFVEIIRQASHQLEVTPAIGLITHGENLLEEWNNFHPFFELTENMVVRRYIFPVGFRGDCNSIEVNRRLTNTH